MAYWHVEHQLPFVEVCAVHKKRLVLLPVNRSTLCLPPQVLSGKLADSEVSKAEELFTKISYELFLKKLLPLKLSRVLDCYRIRLKEVGLSSSSGHVYQEAWLGASKQFWRGSLPSELFNMMFENDKGVGFPRCLFYQPGAQHHPIKHILIIGHLFGSLSAFLRCYEDELFQYSSKLNMTKEVKERVPKAKVDNLLVSLSSGHSLRQAAKIARVSVGFAKAIAIQNGFEIERRVQKLFAHERNQILDWLREGLKTQDIAKKMECSVGAVEQLLTQFPMLKVQRKKHRFNEKRYRHRQVVIEYLNVHKSATRGQVQKCINASYLWCFKNDKKWLYLNLPSEIPHNIRRIEK